MSYHQRLRDVGLAIQHGALPAETLDEQAVCLGGLAAESDPACCFR